MHRTCGKVLGIAVAFGAVGLLGACGDNDSTATSTPTLSTTTAAATPSSAPATTAQESAAPAPESPPSESAEPERPAPVPTTEQDTSGMADKERKFLNSLQSQGVTPASPDIALSIGAYVCQGVAAGASEADLSTFVNAMAGSDPSFDPAKMSVEQAGKIYIDSAKQNYC
ncbi:DUF732 domain-containing protein [Nocardia takedensis]|uniref:DUF732 domain-containing protein n=1 Tax=Nocardia takedensis TaxID=259390 RepID=UPI0003086CD1|nr:DUF732 domain-containing protein [Nocardia takedensis]